VEFKLRVLKLLLDWRRLAGLVARAVEEVLGEAEVYVFGSAVEGRLTANSDLDVAVIVPREMVRPPVRGRLLSAILDRAEELGIPWWFPLELHLMTKEDMELLARGGARFVRVRPGEEQQH